MSHRGRIQHGVVVLENPSALPEGTEVEVLPVNVAPEDAVGAALEKLAGHARDLPADLARNHDKHRREQRS